MRFHAARVIDVFGLLRVADTPTWEQGWLRGWFLNLDLRRTGRVRECECEICEEKGQEID